MLNRNQYRNKYESLLEKKLDKKTPKHGQFSNSLMIWRWCCSCSNGGSYGSPDYFGSIDGTPCPMYALPYQFSFTGTTGNVNTRAGAGSTLKLVWSVIDDSVLLSHCSNFLYLTPMVNYWKSAVCSISIKDSAWWYFCCLLFINTDIKVFPLLSFNVSMYTMQMHR